MTKGIINQEDINVYVLNNRNSKYMKKNLVEFQEDVDKSTIKLRDFKITSSLIDRKDIQKTNKIYKTRTIYSTNIIGIYRLLYPIIVQ